MDDGTHDGSSSDGADDRELLAARFEANRAHLRAVAYRMLGSADEAEDAVQEAWLRLNRTDASEVRNLGGWLTTVVGRVCLDMLRSRRARREEPITAPDGYEHGYAYGYVGAVTLPAPGPEQQALLADSVGLALLVVLETLDPAERLAFVLHDMFAVPYDDIAPIVERTPAAARQLASRARRRVQGGTAVRDPDPALRRAAVEAFLAAAREGDFDALLAVLDPEVTVRSDVPGQPGVTSTRRGAANVARGAVGYAAMASTARLVLVDGLVAAAVDLDTADARVLTFAVSAADGRITAVDIVTEPGRLAALDVRPLA
ncbi:sigma-70 family RNA polymerase sigma factor [Streptomyces sp. CBMA29]|uniref:sigma-70 family RNA polymerase sigma factor n=1 Tax=Streptomyces sp. CBMA29 TaxID=1896314 RepID=UPI001661922D|nr:sigma-70 family RNA polymerase sigma factor [Streptomyces sp. CBMA29]MBD0738029.1 RNA polymerase subunit sigma-70 [Streptomyces sp. CBMA29]